jgi:formate/nitrite transporter
MNIAGGIAHMAKDDPGISTFVFAALFPVNLLIILLTGGVLITGVSCIVPAAVLEGKAHWTNIPKYFAISWLGNLCGALAFAFVIQYIDLNDDVADMKFDLNGDQIKYTSAELCGRLAKKVAEKKVARDFFQTFVKGIGCNWMVCMAVFLSGQAQDMTGKMVGIWFPISCFVAIGFEHIPANMYMIPLGLLAGADVTVWEVIWKNFIPTTLGNIVAGSLIVACGYSFSFGTLGGMSSKAAANGPEQTPEQDSKSMSDIAGALIVGTVVSGASMVGVDDQMIRQNSPRDMWKRAVSGDSDTKVMAKDSSTTLWKRAISGDESNDKATKATISPSVYGSPSHAEAPVSPVESKYSKTMYSC